MQKLKNAIINFRWPIIIVFVLATLFMVWKMTNVKIDTDTMNILPDTMPSRVDSKKIENTFGSTDVLMYILQAEDILNEKTLQRVDNLARAFKKVDGVKKVISLSTSKDIKGENGSMVVAPAVIRIPSNPVEKEALRKSLKDNELVNKMVVSEDFKATAIIVTLKVGADYKQIYEETEKIVADNPGDEKVSSGGLPAFQARIQKDIVKDMSVLLPLALIIMLVVLYGFFRAKRSVLLPFFVVMISIIFGMGLLPILGWKITMLTLIMPIMVVAYANNYGIYLMARYHELNKLDGEKDNITIVAKVLKGLASPIFFTGLITISGILGLLTHIMVPAQQVGVTAALAIGFSVLASLAFIPAALSLFKLPESEREKKIKTWIWLDKSLAWTSKHITGHTHQILWIAAIVVVLGLAGSYFVKIDTNMEHMFPPNHPISKCYKLIDTYFGGAQNISLVFEGDIKDPKMLRAMDEYKQELIKMPGVGNIMSMSDVMKIMSRALNDKSEPGYNKIPDSREAVAQYLELYSMSGDPDDFEQLVDFDFHKAHFNIRLNDGSTPVVNKIMKKVREIAKNDPRITMIGGYSVVFAELGETLIEGQTSSILIALAVIMLLVMLLFRSGTAGFLFAAPLGLSIIAGLGVIGIFNINLDIATTLIASIVMGTGVDFTVQYLWKYRELRREGMSPETAMSRTLIGTGRAIAFNAICVVSGFGVLVFSSMPPLRHLAILFTVMTMTCMLGTLIIVPVLCVLLRPKFLEPQAKLNQK